MMFLSYRLILVTEFPVQVISGQSQGDEVEVQDWMDGGFRSCCLRLRRMVRSSVLMSWEITAKGMEIRRRMKRARGVSGNGKSSLVILGGFRVEFFLPGNESRGTNGDILKFS